MPIYEYKCSNCDYKFEQLHKNHNEKMDICPKCQMKTLIKLISITSFKLKGSGWYITDFKNEKTNKEKKTTTN